MAFSLKKWITGQMESARLNDYNDNMTAIEGAIDTLQTNASLLADQVFSGSTQIPVTSDYTQAVLIAFDKQIASYGRMLALEIGTYQADSRNDQTFFVRIMPTLGYINGLNARVGYRILADRTGLYLHTNTTGATLYIKKIWDMGGLFS